MKKYTILKEELLFYHHPVIESKNEDRILKEELLLYHYQVIQPKNDERQNS